MPVPTTAVSAIVLTLALTVTQSAIAQDKIANSGSESLKLALREAGKTTQTQASLTKAAYEGEAPLILEGKFAQGGLVTGKTEPGAQIDLDGRSVMVDGEGHFLLGFHRDHPAVAHLTVTLPDGSVEKRALDIEDREFKIERIDGLPPSKVDQYTEEQLKKIADGTAKKKAARAVSSPDAMWRSGFIWPVTGRISGLFGSQRILNGVEKRPHSGTDVARPTGTPIKAPADGIIRLAESDMYFEGGLVFIDHGQNLETAIMHMSRIDVTPGQRVNQGDVIGAIGATGRATGPHMHWSLKWQNRLLDPQLITGPMPAGE